MDNLSVFLLIVGIFAVLGVGYFGSDIAWKRAKNWWSNRYGDLIPRCALCGDYIVYEGGSHRIKAEALDELVCPVCWKRQSTMADHILPVVATDKTLTVDGAPAVQWMRGYLETVKHDMAKRRPKRPPVERKPVDKEKKPKPEPEIVANRAAKKHGRPAPALDEDEVRRMLDEQYQSLKARGLVRDGDEKPIVIKRRK